MPLPLCFWVVHPSICPSVRPSEAQNTLFPPLHGFVGPYDQPWHFTACPSVLPSGEVSRHLLENAWREWPAILHAVVSWPPSELIRIWSRSVDFPPFGVTLTQWNGSNLGFPGISQRTYGGNGLKFCMVMYLDHFQSGLVYGMVGWFF